MSRKRKCTQCKNYFESDSKQLNNYCSDECIKKAYKKRSKKKQKRSKYKKEDGTYNLRWYKEQAWDEFSIYIRTRDCLRFKDSLSEGFCITCKRDYPFKKLQAGHFISGRGNAVLFDETCVYSQCYSCNIGRGGSYVEYFVFMEQEWGREYIEELRLKKKTTIKYTESDLIELKETFILKTKKLVDEFNGGRHSTRN